jgi:DNA-binding XRE family transcriptional regulator
MATGDNLSQLLELVARLKRSRKSDLAKGMGELIPLLLEVAQQPGGVTRLERLPTLSDDPEGTSELLEVALPLVANIAGEQALSGELQKLAEKFSDRNMTVPGFSPYEAIRDALAKNTFARQGNTPWPTALLDSSEARGQAQLIPALMDEQPLMPPEEVEKWSELMWKQREELSDLDADALDMLSHVWLQQVNTSDDYAVASVDDFLHMRGIKPKQGGGGRRGGFEPEQRADMLKALAHLQNLWLNMGEVEVADVAQIPKRRRNSNRQSVQSRAFVITDRMGQARLDGYLDVQKFAFRPGLLFARFLFGPGRQTALLSAKAVQYDPYRQKWEKRLARYLSWQWRVRAIQGDYNRPYLVQALLDAVGEGINTRYPAKTRERLEKALENLKEDEVIAGWEYREWDERAAEQRGWNEIWLRATILIVPPQSIKDNYRLQRQLNGQSHNPTLSGQLRQHRKERKLSQAEAALELGVTQSYLSKLEAGTVEASPAFKKRLEDWMADS